MTTAVTIIVLLIIYAITWVINKLHAKNPVSNNTSQKRKPQVSMNSNVWPQFSPGPTVETIKESNDNPAKHFEVKQEPEESEISKKFDIKKAIIYKEILEPKFKEY